MQVFLLASVEIQDELFKKLSMTVRLIMNFTEFDSLKNKTKLKKIYYLKRKVSVAVGKNQSRSPQLSAKE